MTTLRRRMIESMQLRNLAPTTQRSYIHYVSEFARYYSLSPEHLDLEAVRQYQLHLLQERKLSPQSVNSFVSAVQFLYLDTLDMPWKKEDFPRARTPRTLPVVLSPDQVRRLFEFIPGIKNRAALMLCFGAGLRVSEAAAFKAANIDSARMLLRVELGKGSKDRYTTLSPALLDLLRIYCVIPGGGFSADYDRWIPCRPGFFLPVRVLSRLFRRLFLEALQAAFDRGQLGFFGEPEKLRDAEKFAAYLAPLREKEWVVYAKPPFGGAVQTLEYLGRYTHRVALSNDRLLATEQGTVTFQWKDYRGRDRLKSRRMTLDTDEFIRRFLIHVLPDGFQRIRHCGFLANRHRKGKLEHCRRLLSAPMLELLPEAGQCAAILAVLATHTAPRCPQCGIGAMVRVRILEAYRWPARPSDTS